MCEHRRLLLSVLLHFLLAVGMNGVQDWSFVLQRFEFNTTDSDLVVFDLQSERLSPGVYAVNGTATTALEIDDSFSAELKVYRSSTGSSDYKLTPYQVKKCSFYKFMNALYVKILQKDLAECSDFPQYEEKCDSPLPIGTYHFNMCYVTSIGMTSHLQPGYYKAVVHVEGEPLTVYLSALFKVEAKTVYK